MNGAGFAASLRIEFGPVFNTGVLPAPEKSLITARTIRLRGGVADEITVESVGTVEVVSVKGSSIYVRPVTKELPDWRQD